MKQLKITYFQLCFFLLFLVSLLNSFFYYLFIFDTGALFKLLFHPLYWMSLFFIPYGLFKHFKKEFSWFPAFLLFSLVGLGVGQFLRQLVYGDKWLTLFINNRAGLLFALPLYAVFALLPVSIPYLIRLSVWSVKLNLLTLVAGITPFTSFSAYLLPAVSFFLKKKYIIWGVFCLLLQLTDAYLGGRQWLIIFIFNIVALVVPICVKSLKWIRMLVLTIITLPFFIFAYTVYTEESPLSYLADIVENEEINADSRTFLYLELFEDLTDTETWWFGKGPSGLYYSNVFSVADPDQTMRFDIEVTILRYLLKGGVVYVGFYLLLILCALYRALRCPRNRLQISFAILLSGWFFNLFIGDNGYFSFAEASAWVLIGICLSNTWENYTDKEILQLFNY